MGAVGTMTNNTSVIQYEVLQWVWTLGREYDEVQEYRAHIKKILGLSAEKGEIDFVQLLKELQRGDF